MRTAYPHVAEAVMTEMRRGRIHLTDLGYETLVFGRVVRQDFAHRKPTIHADGTVTVTWQGHTRRVIAERWTLPSSSGYTRIWYSFRLGEVVEAPSGAGSRNT